MMSGNNYLWQLMVGGQWLKIENDHVIETHYCQPGAKGITINTSIGKVFIDFDELKTDSAALKVRRLSFVPQGQAEDIAWYYRDDDLWCEYGSQSSNMSSTSIDSKDIEMHFTQNPRGTIQFTIGLTTYSLDFYTMTQINLATGSCRDVRRRPKFTLNDVGAVQLGSALQMLSLGSQPQWQFEGHSGAWYKFKHRYGTLTESSLNSNEIERKYQQNPTDCITFTVNGYPYKLDFAVSGNHYEWQLLNGSQWLKIENDHVIETHYCQAGAKGITINTSLGKVFIDFDELKTDNAALRVQRLSFFPQGQTEDIGWYFRDDNLWREYGSQSSNMSSSSISSKDIETHFTQNPRGVLQFSVGQITYSLDFSTMTQTNQTTGLRRNVRRRPKFTLSEVSSINSSPPLPLASQPLLHNQSFKWEFMGEEGQWTEYQAHICSLDSSAIEKQYQQNPQGQIQFHTRHFSYTLDLASMFQVNNNTRTKRSVRRSPDDSAHRSSSLGTNVRWQFKDIDGIWKDYSNGFGQCTITSAEIELQYQQNPSATMFFNTARFRYELNLSAMTQRNLSTNTIRSVKRLLQ